MAGPLQLLGYTVYRMPGSFATVHLMMDELKNKDSRRVRFGIFEVDLKSWELRRSGIRVRLQRQPFKVLAALLEQPGAIVSREDLQHQLWGSGTNVDFEHSLGIAVNKLREALGDSADNPRFIETLAKRGYRFIAPVTFPPAFVDPYSAEPVLPVPAAAPPTRTIHRWHEVAVVLACICAALAAALLVRTPVHRPYPVSEITHSGMVMTNDVDLESLSSSASDGTRIYFPMLKNGTPALAEALATNGEIRAFHLPSEIGAPLIGALSPDGSNLVLRSHAEAQPEQPLWIVPTLGGDARRVPNVLAHDATWMPDGERLLVASGSTLTVMNSDGSDAHPLLTVPGRVFWMRWSPDGKRLRFTLRDSKRQTSALWEAAADGSHARPLLPDWSHPGSECCGSWTSDGEYFVFQSWHSGHSEIWARREHPWYLQDRQPHEITGGPLSYEAPIASPRSHQIYFVGADVRIELLRAQPNSSAFIPLDENLSSAAFAGYSHDGRWVAWLNASDGSLWRSRIDGSERIELTKPPLRIFSMRWSPNDKRLALMAEEPGRPWKIYVIDADGGKLVPVLNDDRNEADPDWSVDGQTIVFGRLPDRMDSIRPKAIYLLNLQSHQLSEISGSTDLFSPRFSPDGRYIAAMTLDQRKLLLFERLTGRWTTLTTHNVGDPTWSHDSRYLYFQDFIEPGKPIYRITIPAGKPELVTSISKLSPIAAADYRLIGLGPGDLPIVSARTSTVNLYKVDLDEH